MTNMIQHSLSINTPHILETMCAWMLLVFSHVVGMVIDVPLVSQILPYIQIIGIGLASTASMMTIYKINVDLKKGKKK